MKLRCKVQPFRDCFQLVSGIAKPRSPRPILSNVMIHATEKYVELVVTDLEVGIRTGFADTEVEEPGVVLAHAATLGNIVSECDDETINLGSSDMKTVVRYTNAEYELQGSDPDEFPVVAEFDPEGAVELNAEDLKDMIRHTHFAASRDATSFALMGLYFVMMDEEMRLVGADRHRLAYMRKKAPGLKGAEADVIVPTKAMELLGQMMTDDEETVGVKIADKQILFKVKRGLIAAQLVEGKYPNYNKVIPKDAPNKLSINSRMLLHALRQAMPVAPDESRSVMLDFTKNKLAISAIASDKGSAEINVPIEYDGDAIKMSLNPEFLIDGLKVLGDSTVAFELIDGETPGLIRSEDYYYVVMPMEVEK